MQQWWHEPGFLAFDTETTGIDPSTDRIVTAAVVRFEGGQPVEVADWLLQCDIPIPPRSTEVHGVTDEMSRTNGQAQSEGLRDLRAALMEPKLPIVAFNAVFDIDMLNANLQRHGLPIVDDRPVLCPMVLDRQFNRFVRGSGQRKLMPTAHRYQVAMNEHDWHGATPDAIAAGQIMLAQLAAYPTLQELDPHALASKVEAWRIEQDRDFRDWLSRQPAR